MNTGSCRSEHCARQIDDSPGTTVTEQTPLNAWAVVLAGGEGTRLRGLTRRLAGDARPKQFCRIFGGRSLLRHTRERLRPVFRESRTLFVVASAHQTYFKEELSDAAAWRVVVQPENRGTAVAMIVALLRVLQHNAHPVIAFFPSDHYFADDAAFASIVRSAVAAARQHTGSLVLLGAVARGPEVEYGWIEPGAPVTSADGVPLLRVRRFWEKPELAKARELMSAGCLWNTFVTVGHADAFLNLLASTVPIDLVEAARAIASGDPDRLYRDDTTLDFSRDVLSREPQRLLVIPDACSGWTDLGSPGRVIDTLTEHRVEAAWLQELHGMHASTAKALEHVE